MSKKQQHTTTTFTSSRTTSVPLESFKPKLKPVSSTRKPLDLKKKFNLKSKPALPKPKSSPPTTTASTTATTTSSTSQTTSASPTKKFKNNQGQSSSVKVSKPIQSTLNVTMHKEEKKEKKKTTTMRENTNKPTSSSSSSSTIIRNKKTVKEVLPAVVKDEKQPRINLTIKNFNSYNARAAEIEQKRKEKYDLALSKVIKTLDTLYKSDEFAIVVQENKDTLPNRGCCVCSVGTDVHAKLLSLSRSKLPRYFRYEDQDEGEDISTSYTISSSTTKITSSTTTTTRTISNNDIELVEEEDHHQEKEEEQEQEMRYNYVQPSTFVCVKCEMETCYECIIRLLKLHPNVSNSVGFSCPSCSYFNCNTLIPVPNEDITRRNYVTKVEMHHVLGKSYIKSNPTLIDPLLPFGNTTKPILPLEDAIVEVRRLQKELYYKFIEYGKERLSTLNKRKRVDEEGGEDDLKAMDEYENELLRREQMDMFNDIDEDEDVTGGEED